MRLLIDSNVYTDLWRDVPEVVKTLEDADAICVPFIVLGELRSGFLNGMHTMENEYILRQFLSQPDVEVVSANEATTVHYGAFHHQLRMKGTPIPTNDVWIAALAFQYNLYLYSRDKHFDHLPQLMRG